MLDTKTQDQKLCNEPGEDSFWSLMLFFSPRRKTQRGQLIPPQAFISLNSIFHRLLELLP